MGLRSHQLPYCQYSSLTFSTHLWTESLHLVFSNDHFGDDDKDRGALERRRERKKPSPYLWGRKPFPLYRTGRARWNDLAKVAGLTRGIQRNLAADIQSGCF